MAMHIEESAGTQVRGETVARRRREARENVIGEWQPKQQDRGARASSPDDVAPRAVSAVPAEATDRKRRVPAQVREHFVRLGNEYYFADGARAFSDKGTRLATRSENVQLIRDLVEIAQARGWARVQVSGTERFRREAWWAAKSAGLEVRGYRASALEQERLTRSLASGVREESTMRDRSRREASEPKVARPRQHAGTLIDHGPAPYHHDPKQPMSYFVTLQTRRGEQQVWGVDLERALRDSLSRPQRGDEVILRAVKQEPVRVTTAQRDGEGREVAGRRDAVRNRWIVEKQEFLERRQEAAQVLRDPKIAPAQGSRAHPELIGAYLQMHAAELAAKQFRDAPDRERFVALVRGALADSVGRGEPLPAVRVKPREAGRGTGSAGEERRANESKGRAR